MRREYDNSIDGYVYDGLVAMFDGINNTRNGHNASATVWEDISGNGHDMTPQNLNGQYSWYDDHLRQVSTSGAIRGFATDYVYQVKDGVTLEVVIKRITTYTAFINGVSLYSNSRYRILSVGSSDSFATSYMVDSSVATNYRTDWDIYYHGYIDDNRIARVCGRFRNVSPVNLNNSYVLVLNGTFYTNMEGTINNPNNIIMSSDIARITTFPHESDKNRYNTKDIYAIRLYDRALTNEEILNNQALDLMRFGEQ